MVFNSLLDVSGEHFCLSDKSSYAKLEESMILNVEEEYYQPITGEGPYGNGSRVTFKFQPKGFVDWSTLRFEAALTITRNTANVTGDIMPYWVKTATGGIDQCIKRIVIRIGSTVVVDLDNYNSWTAWLQLNNVPIECGQSQQWSLENQIYTQNSITQFYGIPDQSYNVANTQATISPAQLAGAGGSGSNALDPAWNVPRLNRTMEHRFGIGFLNVQKYFPAHLVGNFQMDLYLDNDYRYLQLFTTNFGAACTIGASASLSKCRIYYSTITALPAFEEGIRKAVETDSLYIPFLQLRNHVYAIPPSTQNFYFKITEKVASLKSIFILPQMPDDYNVTSPPSGVLTVGENSLQRFTFGDSQISPFTIQPIFFQLQINGLFHPTYPITTRTEFIVQRMIAAGTYYTRKPGGQDNQKICGFMSSFATYFGTTVAFIQRFWPEEQVLNQWIGYDLDRENCPELLTGYNSILTQSDIGTQINFNSTKAAGTVLNVFTLFNSTLRILNNGSIDVAR